MNRGASLRHAFEMLEKAGNLHNLRLAAGLAEGKYRGRNFLDSDVYKWLEAVACRFADHICDTFGAGRREGTCGHPEIEMALVEPYRVTGRPRYLEQAELFIDRRGRRQMRGLGPYGPEYHQDHVPVRQVTEAAGHMVRQLYLAAGITDLYLDIGYAPGLATKAWRVNSHVARQPRLPNLLINGLAGRYDPARLRLLHP